MTSYFVIWCISAIFAIFWRFPKIECNKTSQAWKFWSKLQYWSSVCDIRIYFKFCLLWLFYFGKLINFFNISKSKKFTKTKTCKNSKANKYLSICFIFILFEFGYLWIFNIFGVFFFVEYKIFGNFTRHSKKSNFQNVVFLFVTSSCVFQFILTIFAFFWRFKKK